jgi:hypothetical protein
MGPDGAVRSFRALGGHGLLMPIHWGLFDLALHPWRQPIETIVAVKDLKLWSPAPEYRPKSSAAKKSAPTGGVELDLPGRLTRFRDRRLRQLSGGDISESYRSSGFPDSRQSTPRIRPE